MSRVLLLIPMLAVLLLQTMSAACDARCGAGMAVPGSAQLASEAMPGCGPMRAAGSGVAGARFETSAPMAGHVCRMSEVALTGREVAIEPAHHFVRVDMLSTAVAGRGAAGPAQVTRVAGGPPLERTRQLRV